MENALNLLKKASDEKIRRFGRVLQESATAAQLFPMPLSTLGGWHPDSHRAMRSCSQHSFENFEFSGIRQPNVVSEIRGASCSQ